MVRASVQLTLLYRLGDFSRILGEVEVGHVGLQVANGALPSCHAESLDGQICEDPKSGAHGAVQSTARFVHI